MEWFQAVVLGLIQGLTEFLPVSSSGHLTIFKAIFGIEADNLSFEVAVHAATVLSTIVAFRKEIWDIICGVFKFRYNSVLLFVSETLSNRQARKAVSEGREPGKEVGYKEAFIIGLSQALAVLPGLSRSGTTISTGLMLGVRKSSMAQFSFLMVLIPILGEAFLQLVGGDFSAEASGISTLSLLLGTLTAFVSGYIACRWMIRIVQKARLRYFSIYCCVAAAFCFIFEIVQNV